MGVVHFLMLFGGFLALAWGVRKRQDLLYAVMACGSHYVGFASMGSAVQLQATYFAASPLTSVMCILFILAMLVLITLCVHKVLDGITEDEFVEKLEDVEHDAAGMTLAFLWTQSVRFMLSERGTYPRMEGGEGEESVPHHTAHSRNMLLIYCVGLLLLSVAVLRPLELQAEQYLHSHILKRGFALVTPFLMMSVAWGFLLWADWTFYEHIFKNEGLLGRLMFSLSATTILVGAIYVTATQLNNYKWRRKFVLGVCGLVIGFSWEEVFDEAIECLAEGYGHGHPVMLKLFLALLMAAILMPVYIFYLKPIVERERELEELKLSGRSGAATP